MLYSFILLNELAEFYFVFFSILPICYRNCHCKRSGHFHNPNFEAFWAGILCSFVIIFTTQMNLKWKKANCRAVKLNNSRRNWSVWPTFIRAFFKSIYIFILNKTIDKLVCLEKINAKKNTITPSTQKLYNPCYLLAFADMNQITIMHKLLEHQRMRT